jgi:hypothetical protein
MRPAPSGRGTQRRSCAAMPVGVASATCHCEAQRAEAISPDRLLLPRTHRHHQAPTPQRRGRTCRRRAAASHNRLVSLRMRWYRRRPGPHASCPKRTGRAAVQRSVVHRVLFSPSTRPPAGCGAGWLWHPDVWFCSRACSWCMGFCPASRKPARSVARNAGAFRCIGSCPPRCGSAWSVASNAGAFWCMGFWPARHGVDRLGLWRATPVRSGA